jgi:hypothetical protein
MNQAPFRSDIIRICHPDGAWLYFVLGSTKIPRLTALGKGEEGQTFHRHTANFSRKVKNRSANRIPPRKVTLHPRKAENAPAN